MIDMDKLKLVNDMYGHQAGDTAIATLGTALTKVFLRQSDVLCRYGGDEFGVAFPNCGVLEAQTSAGRICEKVRNLKFGAMPGLEVTSSVGCAVLSRPSACEDALSLIELADQALYDAKHRGRDGFSVFEWPRP